MRWELKLHFLVACLLREFYFEAEYSYSYIPLQNRTHANIVYLNIKVGRHLHSKASIKSLKCDGNECQTSEKEELQLSSNFLDW